MSDSSPFAEMQSQKLQREILAVVLDVHPAELTLLELAEKIFKDLNEMAAGIPLACAVRDLAVEGLLKCRGPLILPTRSALHIKQLELYK